MPTATNMAQLEAMIRKEMVAGLQMASIEANEIMNDAIKDFYAGGEPVMYQRTHQLDQTPETTEISQTGNSAFFDAYLNDSGGYYTGSQPSMSAVLQLTNNGSAPGLRPAVGSTGYWNRAEQKFQKALDKGMHSRGFK